MSESEERMYHEAVTRLRRVGWTFTHYDRIHDVTLPEAGNAIADALDIIRRPFGPWNHSEFRDDHIETAMPVSLEVMESTVLRLRRTERVLAGGWAALLPFNNHSNANLRVARRTLRWTRFILSGDDDVPMESESDSDDPMGRPGPAPEPEPEPEPLGY